MELARHTRRGRRGAASPGTHVAAAAAVVVGVAVAAAAAVHPAGAAPVGAPPPVAVGEALPATARPVTAVTIARTYTLTAMVSMSGTGGSVGGGNGASDCPNSLAFGSATAMPDGGLAVAFANLTEGGLACSGDGSITFGPPAPTADAVAAAAHPVVAAAVEAGAMAAAELRLGAYSPAQRSCVGGGSSSSTSGTATAVAVAANVPGGPVSVGNASFTVPPGVVLVRHQPLNGGSPPAACVYRGEAVPETPSPAPTPTPTPATAPGASPPPAPTPGGTPPPAGAAPTPAPPAGGGGDGTAATANDEPDCFPADATVETATGAVVRLADLPVGASVRVAAGRGAAAFSPVYLFSHKLSTGTAAYVTARTAAGAALTASPGHLVYASGRRVRMADVAVGDVLRLAGAPAGAARSNATDATTTCRSGGGGGGGDGGGGTVVAVTTASATGRVHPHTLAGDIVVGGVVATCWTTTVPPAVGEVLLAPLRAAWALAGVDMTGGLLEGHSAGGELLRATARWLPGRRAAGRV